MSRQVSLSFSGSGGGPKILIVDDDPAILDSIKLLLEDEGYVVKTSSKGLTTRQAASWQPDLILLDVLMAGHDGRDTCRRLKNASATKDIPVVLVSANRQTDQFASESGADGWLAKPFEIDDLLAIAAKYTNH